MQKQNHSFVYFFAWLVIGVFLGLSILLFRGDISVAFNQPGNLADRQIVKQTPIINPTQKKHSGFAEAVKKAAPAVVSIQTIIWSETSTDESANEKIIQGFLGTNSHHRPKSKAETGSG